MKNMMFISILSFLLCANAQGLLGNRSLTRARVADPAFQLCGNVPTEHQTAVRLQLLNKARPQAELEACERFNVVIDPDAWTNAYGRAVIIYDANGRVSKYDKDGRLVQFGREESFEELAWKTKRVDELLALYCKDQKMVDEALSNVVQQTSETGGGLLNSRSRRIRRPALSNSAQRPDMTRRNDGPLEELIPYEEALALAKEGKGKGYFQLALRYAKGDQLPKDEKTAYKMLCKACDLNYGNAVLIEGLCDESDLRTYAKFREFTTDYPFRKYCGVEFYNGRDGYDLLTNETAFARIMGKYERAKSLGTLAATNQIAALNKRLADFKLAEEKNAQGARNSAQLASLLGDDSLDVEKRDRQAKVEAEKAATEALRAREERRQAEREEQRKQLMEIQEELRRAREARQAAGVEARKVYLPKFQKAFKDLFGVEMGQKVADDVQRGEKSLQLQKGYRYFADCKVEYVDGCLCEIRLRFNSNGKYSMKSLKNEADAVRKDLEARFGITFPEHSFVKIGGWGFNVHCTDECNGLICLSIADEILQKELSDREGVKLEAQKESLPIFGQGK